MTVLASFSASSLSFFSSSRECFSSALAPAPILAVPAALRLTRSLEVSTRMGNELQPPAASSAPDADCPAAAAAAATASTHPMWAKDGAKVLGGRPGGCCAQQPGLNPGAPTLPPLDKPPEIC